MMEAQPIETAPRDGTPIIGISERRYSAGVWRVWWQPEFDAWIESCRMMTLAAGYTYDDGSSRKLHSPEIREPTHWLPYPALASVGAPLSRQDEASTTTPYEQNPTTGEGGSSLTSAAGSDE